ncbi:MAG: hypothetical protein H3Z50_06320 [archaeon]|nr:hypothetical protein [archaeon]
MTFLPRDQKLKRLRTKLIAILAVLIIVASVGIGLFLSQMQEPEGQSADITFHNITVDTAYDTITNGSFPNLVVLDVRTQSEYYMSHLYNAILIPHDELETRIGELEGLENNEIIVYCGSGYRSEIASEVLVEYNFKKFTT